MSTLPKCATSSGRAESVTNEIFISYSRRDKPWVDSYLKRLLNAAEVGFAIDEEDFQIGLPLDESIRKAVKGCRYTLFVMTPDWVRGKWTHYESLLAVEQGSDAEEYRILPIKLKNCEVPSHIAPRLYLDLCEVRKRDAVIVKLLKDLGVSEEGIAKALNSVAKKTLRLLIELLEEPQVRDTVAKLRELFVQIQISNSILTTNKQLHDDLQDIQLTLSQLCVDAPALGSDRGDWNRVWGGTSALCQQIEKLLNHAAAVSAEPVDVSFVEPFKGMSDELDDAVQARDARLFSSYLVDVSRQLDRTLPRINDRIVQHVKDRQVEELVQTLMSVYEEVADVEYDESTADLLRLYRSGMDTLVELDQSIHERVEDHCTLQDADMEFQQMIRLGQPTLYDISIHWRRVDRWIQKLKLTERYEKLLKSYHHLCQQLSDDRSIRDDQFEENVKWNFNRFFHETRKAFNKLDIDLLAICNKLKPHSDELQQILKRMQTDDTGC